MDPKGFFASLFDFSFTEFVTLKIVKFIFILGLTGAAVASLASLVGALGFGGFKWYSLLLAPLMFIGMAFLLRIWLELVMVAFRIADNTSRLVELGKKGKEATTATF
jgi:hypothetical protein